ncbi:MAG: PEGA domain-containing protein [Rhodopirellula sp.]|nr:PEGA domain-containing protein [Rhodopirellula sp.]
MATRIACLMLCMATPPQVEFRDSATTTLYVRTIPPGAHVLVNGTAVGESSAMMAVSPGRCTITVELEGYQPQTHRVEVVAKEVTRVVLELRRTVDREPLGPQPRKDTAPATVTLESWTTGPSIPDVAWGAAAVLGGKFYVVGGSLEHGTNVQVFDPADNRWSHAADLPRGTFCQGVVACDGQLYCLGGTVAEDNNWWGRSHDGAYRYDPIADAWSILPKMPHARSDFLTCVVGGKIYCIGGANHWPNTTAAVDVYDPRTNAWSSLADMPAGRGDPRGGTYRGRIVSVYGLINAQTTDPRIWEYDTGRGSWLPAGTASDTGFGGYGMFLFSDDQGMYFAGGRTGRRHETWISVFHRDTGNVEYLAKAPANRAAAVAGFDPLSRTIYLAAGDDPAGRVGTFEYVQVNTEQGEQPLQTGASRPADRRPEAQAGRGRHTGIHRETAGRETPRQASETGSTGKINPEE